jgi:hypothetical protein
MNTKVIFRNSDFNKYTKSEPNIADPSIINKSNRSTSLTQGKKKIDKKFLQYGENENNRSTVSLNISKNKVDEIADLNKSNSLNYSKYRDSFSGIVPTANKPEIEELSISMIDNSPVMKQNSSRYKRFTNQYQEVKENNLILESLANIDVMSDYDDDTDEV